MGKASKWFNNLFIFTRHRRKSHHNATSPSTFHGGSPAHVAVLDPNKHAIAVAAATAAVAEAALAAAKAAAEVVRLTSSTPPPEHVSRRWLVEDFAAVMIQSAFRGYLARRALRALKALVKLQALVRGHFVRKQSTDMLRRLQALVRVQARARANRAQNLDLTHREQENPIKSELHAKSTEKPDDPSIKRSGSISIIREAKGSMSTRMASNWLDKWVESGTSMNSPNSMKTCSVHNDKGDKILQVDSWKPKSSKHILVRDDHNRSFAASDYVARYSPNDVHRPNASPCAEDIASMKSLHFPLEVYTSENSPQQVCSSESKSRTARKGPMTPLRNEWSRSFLNGSQSPNYMANTKSSRAKSRSYSVPRQREESEKRGLCKRSLQAYFGK